MNLQQIIDAHLAAKKAGLDNRDDVVLIDGWTIHLTPLALKQVANGREIHSELMPSGMTHHSFTDENGIRFVACA